MKINTQHKGDITVINLIGKFDGGKDCEKFQNKVNHLIESGDRKFIFSFSLIQWISSCGLGKLLAIREEIIRCGGRVVLCNLEGRPLSVIYTTRLHQIFAVRETMGEATALFQTVGTNSG